MNHAVTVDASVAVKWVIDEEHTDRAQALQVDAEASAQPMVVPPHFAGEVTNAIYQRVRSTDAAKNLRMRDADDALARFFLYPVTIITPPGLYRQAYTFALQHNLPSIYDSLYVTLAGAIDAELWTADRRLLDALGGAAPWVRFIGDYPL